MLPITIIIPTLDRHDLLLRAIDYYQYFDCNILVADSSSTKENCEFPDNFMYKHLPGMAYAKKILEIAKDVTTQYACLASDDDYLLESSLKAGASFLNANSDYVSVQGRYLGFELIGNEIVFSPRYDRNSSRYAVEAEDRLSRIVEAYNPFMHQFFAIHRTALFVKSLQLHGTSSISHKLHWGKFVLADFLQVLVPMCYGKHKVLPILWMVRDTYTFDSTRTQKNLVAKSKLSSIGSSYRWDNRSVNDVEFFFNSKECGLIKENFGEIIFELVSNKEESDKLFDVACKSFTKSDINDRNKVNIKMMIKLFVPTLVSNYVIKRRKIRHMGGVETTSSAKDTLAKIRLSVLTFPKCYDTDTSRIIK
jgi:glycosyltransferase domain-containing protein